MPNLHSGLDPRPFFSAPLYLLVHGLRCPGAIIYSGMGGGVCDSEGPLYSSWSLPLTCQHQLGDWMGTWSLGTPAKPGHVLQQELLRGVWGEMGTVAEPLMAGKLTTLLVWLVFSLRREPHTYHSDPQTRGRHFWGKSLPDQGEGVY